MRDDGEDKAMGVTKVADRGEAVRAIAPQVGLLRSLLTLNDADIGWLTFNRIV